MDCTCSWSIASSLAGSEVAIGTETEGGSSSSPVSAGTWYVVSSVRALHTFTSWTPTEDCVHSVSSLPEREREGGMEGERERE